MTPSPTRETCALPRRHQLQKSIKLVTLFHVHDERLQLFAAIFTDHTPAERVEFYRDLLFGHRTARIAFGDLDPRRILFPIVRGDRAAAGLEFRKDRFESIIGG